MRQSTSPASLLVGSLLLLAACGSPERSRGNNNGSGSHFLEITINDGAQGGHPRFSPDSATIAFIRTPMGAPEEIARMSTVGGEQKSLAPAGTYLAAPAWAPDGKQLYFASDPGISAVSPDGGAATVVVDDFATMDPDVSPDGKSIVYGLNGSTMQLVDLANPTMPKDLGQSGTSPRFSPDGLSIAYQSSDKIMIMTLATGAVTEVVDAGTYLATVDWFADGARLLITSDMGIEIVTLGATPTRALIRDEFASTDVDLSPDQKSLAYSINGSKNIFVMAGF